MERKGMSAPIRRLVCCCCGAETRGRQWHNRDTGFGLCPRCADWISTRRPFGGEPCSEAEMERLYGRRGEHYDVRELQ